MKRWIVTLLKPAIVATLFVFVFRQIPFVDRIVERRADAVVAESDVQIVGSWQAEPVRYRTADGGQREVRLGAQPDGRTIEVAPGFLTYWRSLDPLLFGLGAFCYFLTALIAGARWWWLLRVNGTGVSLLETLRFTWIGIFFNTVMPGNTGGDVVKALYIMKRCPGHRVPVLVSVIVDRVLGLGSLAILAAVAVLFALDDFGDLAVWIWLVIAGVGLLGGVAFSKRLRQLVRLKWLLDRLPPRIGGVLRLVDQAVFSYREHKVVIAMSLLVGVVNHVISVGSVVLIGHALGVGMPTFKYFVIVPVINILSAIPIAPNAWGFGEALYKGLFSMYGTEHVVGVAPVAAAATMGTRGVALSVLYRLHLTFWSLLGGVLLLFEKDRVTRDDVAREVERERSADDGVA
ncbi:MAG: flippase-like domain-containing protein [Planctomycetes bacterium]|nr:flippase-like domain-containing protein [Planctomycetota bacterium]